MNLLFLILNINLLFYLMANWHLVKIEKARVVTLCWYGVCSHHVLIFQLSGCIPDQLHVFSGMLFISKIEKLCCFHEEHPNLSKSFWNEILECMCLFWTHALVITRFHEQFANSCKTNATFTYIYTTVNFCLSATHLQSTAVFVRYT